jgi:hypothetical protein
VVLSADRDRDNHFRAILRGFHEVPSISSPARGTFSAQVSKSNPQEIRWRLTYRGLETEVRQAHLHFAQPGVNGGIMIWLCGSATNPGPVGTQACPQQEGTITGTIAPEDVVLNAQGITPGEFAEALKALKAGFVYANVHTAAFTGGEIRGQVGDDDHDDDD